MPVEIRELVIKAYIEDKEGNSNEAKGEPLDRESIIADCLEQMSEWMKEHQER